MYHDDEDEDYYPPISGPEDFELPESASAEEAEEAEEAEDDTIEIDLEKSSDFAVEYVFNRNHTSPIWKEFGVLKKVAEKCSRCKTKYIANIVFSIKY